MMLNLESFSDEEIVDYILFKGENVTELEKEMNEASEILEMRGTSVDKILSERDNKNGKTKTFST